EAIVVPMPDSLSVATASLFNVMSNGVDWVLEVGGMQAGMTVAILGPGPRGIASVVAARTAGAAEIAVTGLASDAERLALALEAGADHALDVTGVNPVEAVLGALRSPPDLVVDCTPMSLSSVTDAVNMAARRGVVVLAGMKGPGGMAPIPVDVVSGKQLTIKGAVSRSLQSMEYAISLLASGNAPYEKFASHEYPLERAEEAMHALAGDDKPVHVRIVPST
ncbi:MAG TPA: zinc-binding dehydrogenase, partial [Acidimicrobiales bacterium]|nr:zinc-binding dehydrogenase [Acidimicrobiales bacterium]